MKVREGLKQKEMLSKYGTSLYLIIADWVHPRSKTGIRGVYPIHGVPGAYNSRISINGKEIILLCTHDFDKAVKARKEAEEMYYKPIIDKAIANGDIIIDD